LIFDGFVFLQKYNYSPTFDVDPIIAEGSRYFKIEENTFTNNMDT
jgi:hypothetical protein